MARTLYGLNGKPVPVERQAPYGPHKQDPSAVASDTPAAREALDVLARRSRKRAA